MGQDTRCPGRDSNKLPAEYNFEALPLAGNFVVDQFCSHVNVTRPKFNFQNLLKKTYKYISR
jgi:hypothetical protein